MRDHQFYWKDKNETIIACAMHPSERQVIKPADKEETIRVLKEAGDWLNPEDPDFREVGEPEPPMPPARPDLPAPNLPLTPTVQQGGKESVSYKAFTGTDVSLTIRGFQELLCREANAQHAQYMLAWCQHNRIDPFAGEAHFSIMDNKPVIQISKDCWFKRMEAHPDFVSHDSGVLVRTSREALTVAALTDNEDYLMSPAMKKAITDPKVKLPETMTVKKRGQFVDEEEQLLGAWCLIVKKNRPGPILFQIPLKGWQQFKRDGGLNVFWQQKESFMIWKSALKNGARLAFPDLSGLLGVPEYDEEITPEDNRRLLEIPKGEDDTREDQRKALLGTLHAVGSEVPAPAGPFNHLDLHNLANALYGVESLAHMTVEQLSDLVGSITNATSDGEIAEHLGAKLLAYGPRQYGSAKLKLPRTRTSDQMGVTK